MIAQNESIPRLIADFSPDRIGQLVTDRLAGSSRVPIFHASREEVPEDIVVFLLQSETTPTGFREAAARACTRFGIGVMTGITLPQEEVKRDFTDQVERWANVLDRVAPTELKPLATGLLQTALKSENISSPVLDAIVRAAIRFRLEESDAELWIQLLQREDLCAYGFNALLKIDPQNPRIVRSLLELWESRESKDWKVNAPLLTAKTIRAQGSNSKVKRGLQQLEEIKSKLHRSILSELLSSKIEILRALAAEIEMASALHRAVQGSYITSDGEEQFQETRRHSMTKHAGIRQLGYAVILGDQTGIRHTFINPTGRFSSEGLSDVRINNNPSIFQGSAVVDFEGFDSIERSHYNYFAHNGVRKNSLCHV